MQFSAKFSITFLVMSCLLMNCQLNGSAPVSIAANWPEPAVVVQAEPLTQNPEAGTSCLCDLLCSLSVDRFTKIGEKYLASSKKVYQNGTPSARLIVLQDATSKAILGVISLNVAEAISAINILTQDTTTYVGATYRGYKLTVYDRNWSWFSEQNQLLIHDSDTFANLLN
jgi:hypothetical protein